MSRYLQVIVISFFLVGCSVTDKSVSIGKKAFEKEDLYIMQALEYQQNNQPELAIETFNALYEQSSKINYLVEAAKISFLTANNEKTFQLVNNALLKDANNPELQRIKVALLMKENRIEEATVAVQKLLKLQKSSRNLTIAGAIYFQLKNYELSLKYFQSAYKEHLDENALLNMVDVLYNYLDKKDEAISYLETHTRMHDGSQKVYFKLIEIYGKEQDLDGIISVYKRMYERFDDEEYAKKVVDLYIYKKDKKGAIDFLSNSGYDQKLLLDIYVTSKDFDGAYKVAKKIYEDEDDIEYLGKMAIYEYEKNKNKIDTKILDSVSEKFEKVVSKLDDALYLNYYGYLLIDHDRDVKKGMKLVQQALKKEPHSIYYLDSLAWGYYKAKECKKAKEILDKIIEQTEEEEVLMHYKKIKECIK